MVPTAMLVGLVLALMFPARWSIPAAGVAWATIIAIGVDNDPSVLLGAFVLGSLNGAIGVPLGRGLRVVADHVVSRLRERIAVQRRVTLGRADPLSTARSS